MMNVKKDGAKGNGAAMTAKFIKLLQRIREEFLEAPGLRMTPDEAARFWGLDQQTSENVLDALHQDGFLTRSADGRYQEISLTTNVP